MARPKPEKKPAAAVPATIRVLPMDLQLGRPPRVDETGEYEVIGRPYMTADGKNAHVRVKRVDQTWGAHERVAVRRG